MKNWITLKKEHTKEKDEKKKLPVAKNKKNKKVKVWRLENNKERKNIKKATKKIIQKARKKKQQKKQNKKNPKKAEIDQLVWVGLGLVLLIGLLIIEITDGDLILIYRDRLKKDKLTYLHLIENTEGRLMSTYT